MKLVVGLGNPGKEYENTRHNIGFMAIDKILNYYNLEMKKEMLDGMYVQSIINNEKYIFLKPSKYMNLSGTVIKKYVDYFNIDVEDILVIHDDLDLELGKIRLRLKGSSGGHNGLKDIENNLKTNEYKRIKIGISNNKNIDTKDYVLGHFNSDEKVIIDNTLNTLLEVFKDYTTNDFDKLMNKYN